MEAMNTCLRLLLATIAGLIIAAQPARAAPATAAEKRVALVIGNAAYPGAPLANPVNDARDMAAALRRLGFDVIEKLNVTQKEMNRAIAQFGERLRTDTVALFFYAGHGMQVRGKNYLIPIDAQIKSEASARAETVDVDTVMDQLAVSPLNIVILDACRNNPFERRFRSVGGGLAQMDAPKGSLIAYATAPGKVASDGSGRNGLYTQELLRHIQTPGLPLEAVFKRVRNGVMAGSGEAQTPWESSSLTGDFYFVGGSPAASVPAAPPAPGATAREENPEDDLWTVVERGNTADDYAAYLTQYPAGKYAVLARSRYTRLTQEAETRSFPGVGQRVLGQWGDGLWYPGTIAGRNGDFAHVSFDDGDRADLPRSRIRPIDWGVGTRLQCNWKSGGRYYPGTITRSNGLAVHISYDDGDQEDTSIGKCRSR